MVARSRTWTLSLIMAGGCTTWVSHPIAPDSTQHWTEKSVRLTRFDHSTLTLNRVEINRDSLVGMTTGHPPERAAVALREVRNVQTKEVSAKRTASLVALILLDVLGSAAFGG